MIVGPQDYFRRSHARTPAAIIDGTSNTLMVVEATEAHINWMEPRDLDVEKMQFRINGGGNRNAAKNEISSPHSSGANVALCDGSVRFLNATIDRKVLEAMTTINGREMVAPPEY